jgi:hypothetical protein
MVIAAPVDADAAQTAEFKQGELGSNTSPRLTKRSDEGSFTCMPKEGFGGRVTQVAVVGCGWPDFVRAARPRSRGWPWVAVAGRRDYVRRIRV